jgi:hypothetical protein
MEKTKSNPNIIPALIIAAAILVGSWMVIQSNKEAAEERQRLHHEAQREADKRERERESVMTYNEWLKQKNTR